MKVALIARSTLFSSPGGDTVQVVKTAENLCMAGVSAEVKLCTDKIDYNQYDLLHFFNIIRPADMLRHLQRSKKPYVVSPIFVDYSEYEMNARKGFPGILSRVLTDGQQEYLKIVARRILNGEKISGVSYLLKGHNSSIKYILHNAAALLPNSSSEYIRLNVKWGIEKKFQVIPNGVDETIFKPVSIERNKNLVLCVSRIEGRKNQLNLIRALNNTRFRLLIIGSPSPNHRQYYEQCKKEAAKNVVFTGEVEQNMLAEYYASAQVHVLPSWFETAGLSTLEAAAMGSSIVITDKGDTREYFGDNAFYCEPENIPSIREAVDRASQSAGNTSFREKILSDYTWKRAAEKTMNAYEEVLKMNEVT